MKRLCPVALCAVLMLLGNLAASAASVYGASAVDGTVYLVDTDAGTSTPLFSTGVLFMGATDGDDDASFFATPLGQSLYRVDINAQTATPIGTYGGVPMRELAYNEMTGVLYATDYANLYTVDITTGTPTLIGPIDRPNAIWAMDYDASIDKLVGVNETDDIMYYISMNDGSATVVGPTGVGRMSDVWYDSGSGRMFGVTDQDSELYEVDPMTGMSTYIATIHGHVTGLGHPAPPPTPTEVSTWGGVKARFR